MLGMHLLILIFKCVEVYLMISITTCTVGELEKFLVKTQSDIHGATFFNIEHVRKHFKIWHKDKFLIINFRGKNIEEFQEEFSMIRMPNRCYRNLISLQTIAENPIICFEKIQNALSNAIRDDGWNVSAVRQHKRESSAEIEVYIITKIYTGLDITDKIVFNSLWEIISEKIDNDDMVFQLALKKLKWRFSGDVLELHTEGTTRNSVMLSLRKDEIKQILCDCTGKKYEVNIL